MLLKLVTMYGYGYGLDTVYFFEIHFRYVIDNILVSTFYKCD